MTRSVGWKICRFFFLLARIGGTEFKYGRTKNILQRIDAHKRLYALFILIKIIPCANSVTSEDMLHDYVKREGICVNYGNQREIISLDSASKLQDFINIMHSCCILEKDLRNDIESKRNEIDKVRLQMVFDQKITYEQYIFFLKNEIS
jgi:hypothetical protein